MPDPITAAPAAEHVPAINPVNDAFDAAWDKMNAAASAPAKEAAAPANPTPATSADGQPSPKSTSSTPADGKAAETSTAAKPAGESQTPPNATSSKDGATTSPQDAPPEKMAPKALREAYSALKSRMAEIERERDELRSKPAPTPVDDAEKIELAKRYETAEKRRAELENEIKFVDYEKSAEYQEKYHAHYLAAVRQAEAVVTGLDVPQEDGTVREATPADLWKIVSIPGDKDAIRAAKGLFGGDTIEAARVIAQRDAIRAAWQAGEKAKADFRAQGADRAKLSAQEQAKRTAQMQESWAKLNQEAVEKNPHLFKAADDDKVGQELLKKGFATADLAFSAADMPPERQVQLHSMVRNKAAAFDFIAHRMAQSAAQVKALTEELNALKASAPGGGAVPRGGAAATRRTAEEWLDSVAR